MEGVKSKRDGGGKEVVVGAKEVFDEQKRLEWWKCVVNFQLGEQISAAQINQVRFRE